MYDAQYKMKSIVISIAILGSILLGMNTLNAFANDSRELDDFISIQKRCIEMNAELSDNSMYAQLITKEECHMLTGKNKQEAIKEAQEELILDRALQEKAAQEEIVINNTELDEYISSIIQESKEDDDFSKISDLCEEQGISFEETVWKNKNHYYMELLKNKLYNSIVKKEFNEHMKVNSTTIKKLNRKWEELEENALETYQRSSEYKQLTSYFEKVGKNNNLNSGRRSKVATSKWNDLPYIKQQR